MDPLRYLWCTLLVSCFRHSNARLSATIVRLGARTAEASDCTAQRYLLTKTDESLGRNFMKIESCKGQGMKSEREALELFARNTL